jgi:hypothetical protein
VGAVERLEELLAEVRERLGPVPIEVRLDSAFCQKAILELLTASRVEYAIKMPMWRWLEVQGRIRDRKSWKRVNASIDAFAMPLRIEQWKRTERVVIFRKRISGKPAKHFQLELYQPDDGYYEYSMVATNKVCHEASLWAFMAGRGGHENTLGELKSGLAFGSVVTQDWDANSAWQILNALTHNLVRDFQLHAGIATEKKNSRKRTARRLFRTMRTLRFEWIHLPARVARPAGRAQLRIAAEPKTRERIDQAMQKLAA